MLKNLFRQVTDLLTGSGEVTDELFDELEEVLIASDVSTRVTADITGLLREAVREQRVRTAEEVRDLLRSHLAALL
ncbi:MAG: signal recognition particle receptor subunit alpha, partial [Armatimonadetes bacterium]|nr:signal recognition particle receptor subunit alpha [Armatimonadota bacterium]